MDAIIMAGGINAPDDPLYELTGVEKKALIPLAGKPMVNWVAEAISGSGLIDHIVIVGLEPDEIRLNHAPLHFADRVGGLIDNVLAGVDKLKAVNPAAQKVLLCMSDIPLITPEIVRGFVEECGGLGGDIYYGIVEDKTMEVQYPDSRRTFVPFKDGRFSGGDIYLGDITVPDKTNKDLFRILIQARKNYLAQARMLGPGFIFRFLLRQVTVQETVERSRELLNLDARFVKSRFAEIGMDLDKPHQYELIKAALEKRQAQMLSG